MFFNCCVISIGTIPLNLFSRYNIKDSHILVIPHKISASRCQTTYLHEDLLGTVGVILHIFSALSIICLKWWSKIVKILEFWTELLLYTGHNFGYTVKPA